VYKRLLSFKAAHRQLKLDTTKKLGEFKSVLATVVGPALVTHCNDYKARFAEMGQQVKAGVLERKRLHNVIQELKGNIRVYLRCRPPSQKELGQFGQDAQCVSFPLSSVDVDGASDGGSMVRVVNEKGRDKTWEFDQVFDWNSTQEGVYKEVSELVTSMMDGYNVCIFAYGQTGSGKTFTMAGPPDNCGVNTRALEELFTKSRKRQADYVDVITVSVLEVYNEDIRDLLTESNGEKLEVRQSSDGSGNCVPGLTIVRVNSLQDVVQLLGIADKFRTSASTNMNEHSSRSHMMLTVYVQSENRSTGAVSRGKLNLVDLAGSERLNKSGATGTALKEAQNINKSLSALGDVIAARAAKQGHIPFRNSTLTYLLQDSLSQDSKTLMFVCISPVVYNAEETFCSLNFAARYVPLVD
jgi:kinesin family member C2/C3